MIIYIYISIDVEDLMYISHLWVCLQMGHLPKISQHGYQLSLVSVMGQLSGLKLALCS